MTSQSTFLRCYGSRNQSPSVTFPSGHSLIPVDVMPVQPPTTTPTRERFRKPAWAGRVLGFVAMNAPARFDYVRDDARRRIRVTAHQPLQGDDLIAIVDRQVHEDTWSYGFLYDLRAVQGTTPKADVRAVADHVLTHVQVQGPRGPVALVTRTVDTVATLQIYAFLSAKTGVTVEVFWDLDEAERWLDARAAKP
jgi:hypothetical protein